MKNNKNSDNETRILVTGAAGYWGNQVSNCLIELRDQMPDHTLRLIGIDNLALGQPVNGLDFLRVDLRNRLLSELIRDEKIDTVCHLKFEYSSKKLEANFETNVMGTMKLLGVCADASVEKVVLKSTMEVYGAHPDNAAFLEEQSPIRGERGYGYLRDLIEIEKFLNGFRHQAIGTNPIVLRFAHIVGPTCDTPMTRFLNKNLSPSLLGFDPMMQVIHERDVIAAIVHAVLNDIKGTFNVAALQSLPLSRMMTLAAKSNLPLFHPLSYLGSNFGRSFGIPTGRYFPIPPDYLRYTCVGDLSRMKSEFGFIPHFSAEETLREFATQKRMKRFAHEPVMLASEEELLREALNRRRKERQGFFESRSEHENDA